MRVAQTKFVRLAATVNFVRRPATVRSDKIDRDLLTNSTKWILTTVGTCLFIPPSSLITLRSSSTLFLPPTPPPVPSPSPGSPFLLFFSLHFSFPPNRLLLRWKVGCAFGWRWIEGRDYGCTLERGAWPWLRAGKRDVSTAVLWKEGRDPFSAPRHIEPPAALGEGKAAQQGSAAAAGIRVLPSRLRPTRRV